MPPTSSDVAVASCSPLLPKDVLARVWALLSDEQSRIALWRASKAMREALAAAGVGPAVVLVPEERMKWIDWCETPVSRVIVSCYTDSGPADYLTDDTHEAVFMFGRMLQAKASVLRVVVRGLHFGPCMMRLVSNIGAAFPAATELELDSNFHDNHSPGNRSADFVNVLKCVGQWLPNLRSLDLGAIALDFRVPGGVTWEMLDALPGTVRRLQLSYAFSPEHVTALEGEQRAIACKPEEVVVVGDFYPGQVLPALLIKHSARVVIRHMEIWPDHADRIAITVASLSVAPRGFAVRDVRFCLDRDAVGAEWWWRMLEALGPSVERLVLVGVHVSIAEGLKHLPRLCPELKILYVDLEGERRRRSKQDRRMWGLLEPGNFAALRDLTLTFSADDHARHVRRLKGALRARQQAGRGVAIARLHSGGDTTAFEHARLVFTTSA